MGELRVDFGAGKGAQEAFWTVEDPDRGLHQCDSLERIKDRKVKGRTAIPAGCYEVTLEPSGKYGDDTPTVSGVPGFKYIRIHAGNDADDTEGCIMPALERDDDAGRTAKSSQATRWLRAEIQKRIRAGERVSILIERANPTLQAELERMGNQS